MVGSPLIQAKQRDTIPNGTNPNKNMPNNSVMGIYSDLNQHMWQCSVRHLRNGALSRIRRYMECRLLIKLHEPASQYGGRAVRGHQCD